MRRIIRGGGIDSTIILNAKMVGENNGVFFGDDSQYHHVITPVAHAKTVTAQSKFGDASGAFDGTDDWLTVADNAVFDLSTGDFSIGFFARPAGNTDLRTFGIGNYATTGIAGIIEQLSYYVYWGGAYHKFVCADSITTWSYYMLIRISGDLHFYLNGTESTTGAIADATDHATADGVYIGQWSGITSVPMNGYINDFTIWKRALDGTVVPTRHIG
jgi:hypothetical protein